MKRKKTVDIFTPEAVEFRLKTLELEEDFYQFVLWVFKVIYRRPFIENWHHKVLCNALMDIHAGKLKHTIFNIPPRYTKTEIVVKLFIAWSFAKNPYCEFMHLAYSDTLALDNSSAVKAIIESVEYQERWPVQFQKDSTAKKKWKTVVDDKTAGEMGAMASGGQVTGFGAGKIGSKKFSGALIVDDPIKPEDAGSDTIRESINKRFPETIKSRLNDRNTPMIIIMQRLHENDPVGFLLDGGTELEFTHINLPALNEDGPSKYDPREKGQALWNFKHTAEELEAMRLASAGTFAGQYQQRPAPEEGNIFKEHYFKYYKILPTDRYFKVHSWDMTFKDKSKSKKNTVDYVVGLELGKRRSNNDVYVMPDMVRARMDFPDTLDAVNIFLAGHADFKAVLVEDKANGSAIISSLQKKGTRKVLAIEPDGDKVERAQTAAISFKAGTVWLPHPSIAPWVEDFKNELKVFPNGKHDDQVDAVSQGVNYLDEISALSLKDVNKPTKPYSAKFNSTRGKARKSRITPKSY